VHEYDRIILHESGKEVEMVGFDKVERQLRYSPLCLIFISCGCAYWSNLVELENVVLDEMLIAHANSYSDILAVCPRITSLDLSRNLFSNLSSVAEICRPLSFLKILRLTGNRFSNIFLEQELSVAFSNIQSLSLNMCALNWDHVTIRPHKTVC